MEIGSGGCSGGGDYQQLHGLKFGKMIYFEEATGTGGGSGGVNASSSKPPAGSGKKGKAVAVGGASASAPPRCQVEGCHVDLSGSKQYYCRHKLCSMHSKAPCVVIAGLEQRFCQQCSRFHQLLEFDQGKRSCRRRLTHHNQRRRKPPLVSRYERLRLAASFEEPGRFRSYMLDFSYPRPRVPSSVRDAWPGARPGYRMPREIQWQGNLDLHPHTGAATGYGPHAYSNHDGFPGPELPPGGCLAWVAADSSCALSLLSTQPWDNNPHGASHDHLSAAANPVAVSPSIMASNYMPPPASPWSGFRGHEGGWNAPHQQLPHDVPLHEVHPASSSQHGHFSGELDHAMHGNRPAPGPHGNQNSGGGMFDHPGSSTSWSL